MGHDVISGVSLLFLDIHDSIKLVLARTNYQPMSTSILLTIRVFKQQAVLAPS